MNQCLTKERNKERIDTNSLIPILVVIGSLQVGGTENHLVKVLPLLVSRGFCPYVHVLSSIGPLGQKLREAGITIIDGGKLGRRFLYLPPPIRGLLIHLSNILSLSLSLFRTRAALCHCLLPAACVDGGLAALIMRQRNIIMSRRSLNAYQLLNPWQAKFERWAMRRARAVLGNSRAVISQLREEGVPSDKLGLIYNGIDLQKFADIATREQIRQKEGIKEGSFIMLIVGNLIPYKGHVDLIEALRLYKTELPNPWLLLCAGSGDNDYLTLLKKKTVDAGLVDNIRFLGIRHDVPALYKAADLGLLVSHEEGFSNAILEGMAAGIPMVVSAVGGNIEAVEHEITGVVIPPRDPERLGQIIVELAHDPKHRQRLANAGLERLKKYFSLEYCVNAYARLYDGIFAEHSGTVQEIIDVEDGR